MAWEDLRTVQPFSRPFTRYIWTPDGNLRSVKTTSLVLNYVSRASSIVRPAPANGGPALLRIDLRWYAPRLADLKDWLATWEELAFDPAFSLLVTRDTLDFAGIDPRSLPRRRVRRLVTRKVKAPSPFGKARAVVEEVFDEAPALGAGDDVARFNSRAIDPVLLRQLQAETHSEAPVVHHAYFKMRALGSVKDQKVYAKVFGGLYYEFRGIKKAAQVRGKEKATDLDVFFERLGIGNIRGGENADQLFERLRSDQGVALFRSDVTGSPRDVWAFHTPSGNEGSTWGAITGDLKNQSIDIGDRSFANLLRPRRDAREAIFGRANGLLDFALFDGKGALQDSVPEDVAVDTTIPNPHTKRLEIRSCITCHSITGKDGWQPLRNDVKTLLAGRLDIYDDAGTKRLNFTSDVIDRLAGRYLGDFSKNLRRARDDLAEGTLKATGPWPGSADQTDVAGLAARQIHGEHDRYWWQLVTPQRALAELGVGADAGQAAEVFRRVVVPLPGAYNGSFYREDPRLAALAAGIAVTRADWALAHAFAAERARRSPLWQQIRRGRR